MRWLMNWWRGLRPLKDVDSHVVTVCFRDGGRILLSVDSREDFMELVNAIDKMWGGLVFLGPDLVVRKDDIASVRYSYNEAADKEVV